MFWFQILPLPTPFYLIFLNIVQYLYVHCTIPSILCSHPHTPHHPLPPTLLQTDPLPLDQPHPTPRLFCFCLFNSSFTFTLTPPPPNRIFPTPQPRFFLNFHNNFTSSFTFTLTPDPLTPDLPDPLPPPLRFFFEFSQNLQFFVQIHRNPPPLNPPPPPPDFFLAFSQKLQFFVHIHPDHSP